MPELRTVTAEAEAAPAVGEPAAEAPETPAEENKE